MIKNTSIKFIKLLFDRLKKIMVVVSCMIMPSYFASAQPSLSYGTPEVYSECGGFIESPTFSPNGHLWLLDIPANRILSVDSDGECVERGKSRGTPNGLLFHKDGRLFVGDSTGLLLFDTDSSVLSVVVDNFEGEPLVGINDLVFDKEGGLYFTASNGSDLFNPVGQVFYLAAGSSSLTMVTDKLAFPNGIAMSADGAAILVAEFGAQRIVSIPAVGSQGFGATSLFARTEGGVGPDGMTMGADGKLYVANLGSGRIQVFGSNGFLLSLIHFPESAGALVSNAVIKEEYLYITEGAKGEVWRISLND